MHRLLLQQVPKHQAASRFPCMHDDGRREKPKGSLVPIQPVSAKSCEFPTVRHQAPGLSVCVYSTSGKRGILCMCRMHKCIKKFLNLSCYIKLFFPTSAMRCLNQFCEIFTKWQFYLLELNILSKIFLDCITILIYTDLWSCSKIVAIFCNNKKKPGVNNSTCLIASFRIRVNACVLQ